MPANACNGVLAACIATLKPFQDCLPPSSAVLALCTVSGVFARIRQFPNYTRNVVHQC